ncbi:Methyl-accepting chemotaxis protein (MCP) signaling domain protein [compost metagenome]
MRNLASRSAEASKEIRELIVSSSRQIDEGAQLVLRAEQSIEGVVAAVTKVNDIMGEIAAASDEQSGGIAQVNQAVAQMDDVTQRNAGLVQRAAQASADLEGHLADALRTMGVFKMDGQQVALAPAQRSVSATTPAQPHNNKAAKRPDARPVEEWSDF